VDEEKKSWDQKGKVLTRLWWQHSIRARIATNSQGLKGVIGRQEGGACAARAKHSQKVGWDNLSLGVMDGRRYNPPLIGLEKARRGQGSKNSKKKGS